VKGLVRTCIEWLAVLTTFLAAFFLLRSSFGLSADDIADLATTRFGYSSDVIQSLAVQGANTRVGFAVLLLSLLLQFCALWPPRRDERTHENRVIGIALAFALAAIVYAVGWLVAGQMSKVSVAKAELQVRRAHPVQPGSGEERSP
jgi:hypothetical protein